MTVWKIVLISGLTTAGLLALLVVAGSLAWPTLAGWHAGADAWRGAHGGQRWRGDGFADGRLGHACTHLDDATLAAHADLTRTWVERSLSLDGAQQELFEPIVAALADGARALRPLCDGDHDDARAVVQAASTIAEVLHRGMQRIDTAFAVFYDALEPGQREILDGWIAHAHRRPR